MTTIEKKRPPIMHIVQRWIIVTFLAGCCGSGIILLLYLAITSFHIPPTTFITNTVFVFFLFLAVPTIAVSIGQTLLLRRLAAAQTAWTADDTIKLLILLPFLMIGSFSVLIYTWMLGPEGSLDVLNPSTSAFWLNSLLFPIPGTFLLGAALGFIQSKQLRGNLTRKIQWVVVTALIWSISFPLSTQGCIIIFHQITPFFKLQTDLLLLQITTSLLFVVWIFLSIFTGMALWIFHRNLIDGPESTSLPLYEENRPEKRQDKIATANSNAQLSIAGIWLRWIVVTILTGCISTAIMLGLSKIYPIFTTYIFSIYLVPLVPILLVVTAQNRLLRKLFPGRNTSMGVQRISIGILIGTFIIIPFYLSNIPGRFVNVFLIPGRPEFSLAALSLAAGSVIVGILVGLAQSVYIDINRWQTVRWTLATALCWGIGWSVSYQGLGAILQVIHTHSVDRQLLDVAALLTTWIILGILTSIALLWLFKKDFQARDIS